MLKRALLYYKQLQQLDLAREVHVWSRYEAPVVVASDARRDESGPPTVAVLLVDMATGARVVAKEVALEALANLQASSRGCWTR